MSCSSLDDPLLPRASPTPPQPFPSCSTLTPAVAHSCPTLVCSPASLDAFVFSHLVLLLQAKLPSGKLQAHLRGLHNLCVYCTHILNLYFPRDGGKARTGSGLGSEDRRPGSLPFPAS